MELKTFFKHAFLTLALIVGSAPAWSANEAAAAATVNINTADAATLAQVLDGVGAAKAEAIVAHRKQHGPFKSVEQLSEVKGLGDKLVLANRERIVLK